MPRYPRAPFASPVCCSLLGLMQPLELRCTPVISCRVGQDDAIVYPKTTAVAAFEDAYHVSGHEMVPRRERSASGYTPAVEMCERCDRTPAMPQDCVQTRDLRLRMFVRVCRHNPYLQTQGQFGDASVVSRQGSSLEPSVDFTDGQRSFFIGRSVMGCADRWI